MIITTMLPRTAKARINNQQHPGQTALMGFYGLKTYVSHLFLLLSAHAYLHYDAMNRIFRSFLTANRLDTAD